MNETCGVHKMVGDQQQIHKYHDETKRVGYMPSILILAGVGRYTDADGVKALQNRVRSCGIMTNFGTCYVGGSAPLSASVTVRRIRCLCGIARIWLACLSLSAFWDPLYLTWLSLGICEP